MEKLREAAFVEMADRRIAVIVDPFRLHPEIVMIFRCSSV
jgi:hypothetical protein